MARNRRNDLQVSPLFGNALNKVFADQSKKWEFEFFQNFESEHTRRSYRNDIRQFLDFLSAAFPDVSDITSVERAHIVAFRMWLTEQKEFAPKTTNRKMSSVSSYFDFLLEKDVLKFNPCNGVRRPRQEVKTPTNDLSDEQVIQLLDVLHDNETTPLHRAVLYILFSTGIRKSELANLKGKNFRTEGGHWVIDIRAKGGKYLTKVLHPHCVAMVEDYLGWMESLGRPVGPEDYLLQPSKNPKEPGRLNRALGAKSIDYIMQRALLRAGISGRISPHSARASYIGSALEAGVDLLKVSRDVGHASVRTTQEYNKRRQKAEESPAYQLGFFKKSS